MGTATIRAAHHSRRHRSSALRGGGIGGGISPSSVHA
jgi:hypothetical protein